VLAGALGGRMEPSELRRRLEPFGIGDEAAVLVFALEHPAAATGALERALAADACPAVVAPHTVGGRELLCAVVDAADRDPIDLAADVRQALLSGRGSVRAASSRSGPPENLRHSFHEARCALEATALDNGAAPDVASWRDLGAFTLLLSIQDDEALGLYCDSVLGPIEEGDEDYGGELLRSLEAFIEQNGQWERAAREVYCHRHTLRYRMRKVEELTGRDLSRAHDRIEFWLALRAKELVA
jgi:PucR family transcriptional regulator, purine catabolism regulatory protein